MGNVNGNNRNTMPTSMKRLEELIANPDMDDPAYQPEGAETKAWLIWAYNSLEARNLAHKKQAIKQALIMEAARKLLAPDELEQLEREAEGQL